MRGNLYYRKSVENKLTNYLLPAAACFFGWLLWQSGGLKQTYFSLLLELVCFAATLGLLVGWLYRVRFSVERRGWQIYGLALKIRPRLSAMAAGIVQFWASLRELVSCFNLIGFFQHISRTPLRVKNWKMPDPNKNRSGPVIHTRVGTYVPPTPSWKQPNHARQR